ncbi:hypothetical protein V1264_020023 [Littorina saxatilis]
MEVLAKIAVRYDILLVQEIKDADQKAMLKLQDRIWSDHGIKMNLITSDRLGRTKYKEQYAFLYREDRGISVLDSYHFDDGDESSGDDSFEREPFIVRFQASNCEVTDFTLVAMHASTTGTVKELTDLSEVVLDIQQTWKTLDIMILGDLNADCKYVPKKAWPGIGLRQDTEFWWPIDDNVDTTVRQSTDCAYDRFVVLGGDLQEAVVPGTAKPFNFQAKYHMTEAEALKVSDHYPIELELQERYERESTPANNGDEASRASGHTGILETLRHIFQGILGSFSRQKPGSEL